MMRIEVTDRESIEHGLQVGAAFVVISIRDTDQDKARIPEMPGLLGVLYLAFDDNEPLPNLPLPLGVRLMTPGQAKDIWAFVRRHEAGIEAVVVHCEAGLSRSPAVAAALAKAYGQDESRYFRKYMPNQYVYRTMLENQVRLAPEEPR